MQNSLALRSAAITLEKRSISAQTTTETKLKKALADVAKEKALNVAQAAEMMALREEMDATVSALREELVDAASRYT